MTCYRQCCWMCPAVLACGFLGLDPSAAPARGGAGPAIKLEPGVLTRIDAALTDADEGPDGKFVRQYAVRLEKGKTYQVDLKSAGKGGVDPYLLLKGAAGKVVARGTDAGGNARLTYTPEDTMDAAIVVSTAAFGQKGNFTLTVGEAGAAAAPDALDLKGGRAVFEGHLLADDPSTLGKLGRVFSCPLAKDRSYRICLESDDFDAYLHLLGPDGKVLAADDDSFGKLDSEILWHATAGGAYQIVATSLGGKDTGKFTLTVADVDVLAQNNGRFAVQGQVGRDDLRYRELRSKAYAVKLGGGKSYCFDLRSAAPGTALFLIGPGSKLLGSDEKSGGAANAVVIRHLAADGPYHVLAADVFFKYSKFDLTVTEVPDLKLVNGKAMVKDKIPADSPRYHGKPAHVRAVKLEAGMTYEIDLVSDDFDAYLYLLGPDGRKLAEDDDSGGNLNARIRYEVREAGTYHICSCPLGPLGKGNFALSVSEGPKKE